MLQTARKMMYASSASANSEVTDWRLSLLEAHTAFFLRGFFVRSSLLYGQIAQGVERLAGFLEYRYANLCSLPTQLALRSAGLLNLLKETAMNKPTYLYDALKAHANHTLTQEQADAAQRRLESMVRTILCAAADAECYVPLAEYALELQQITYILSEKEA